MSAEDGYGIEIISPEAMLDDLTVAHEFGHVVTMQQKAWVDQEITGAWWEPLANWFREMYLDSDYYPGNTKTAWFEPYLRNLSLTLPHGRNYYEVWPFLMYISYNPDDLPGLPQRNYPGGGAAAPAAPDKLPDAVFGFGQAPMRLPQHITGDFRIGSIAVNILRVFFDRLAEQQTFRFQPGKTGKKQRRRHRSISVFREGTQQAPEKTHQNRTFRERNSEYVRSDN